tara:strand:- start:22174 stop:23034 length:861 start_codon:yes stop_codon:yes gene_type:complete
VVGCHTAPRPVPIDGGAAADNSFLGEYQSASRRALAETPLAILNVDDELVVIRHGVVTSRHSVSSDLYDALKDVAHVLMAAWLSAWHSGSSPDNYEMERLESQIRELDTGLDASAIPADQRACQRRLLDRTTALLSMMSRSQGIDDVELNEWARSVKKDIMTNVTGAARAQLDAINRQMTSILSSLDEQESKTFLVVVCGVHQARKGNVQMQYFTALLGPEASSNDRRLIFAESVEDFSGAMRTLAVHQLDKAISESFFGSPSRMQRDLLEDAASDLIPKMVLPRH